MLTEFFKYEGIEAVEISIPSFFGINKFVCVRGKEAPSNMLD